MRSWIKPVEKLFGISCNVLDFLDSKCCKGDFLGRVALWSPIILACLLVGGSISNAQSPQKIALVIGNGNYRSVNHLINPTNDADLIASKLTSLGFSLVGGGAQKDLSLAAFKSALTQFSIQAATADVAIFYYAGHGVQVDGINYLVPIDSNPVNGAKDVPLQMVDASSILRDLDHANSRLKFLILDSCRNNPFASRGLLADGLADMTGGLAAMSSQQGTVVWFATAINQKAQDGSGNNGPFALAISHNIDTPGVGIFDFINRTGYELVRTTNPAQVPFLTSTPVPGGTFYFKEAPHVDGGTSTTTTNAVFAEQPNDPTPSDRIRRLFSSGITTPTRSFTLGETYTQINSKLDQPFAIQSWSSLPQAGEFSGREVRYYWVRLFSLPVVSSAIVPSVLGPGQCIDPQSYVTFLFEHEKLFSISIRLYKSQACHSYGWLSSYLFSGDHRSALVHDEQGDTTVNAHETPDFTIIDISRLDSSKIWLD
jgi:hypothetical protein